MTLCNRERAGNERPGAIAGTEMTPAPPSCSNGHGIGVPRNWRRSASASAAEPGPGRRALRQLRWTKRVLAAALVSLVSVSSPAADVFWSRAEVLEQIHGVAEVRGPVQARLELPDPQCETGPFSCTADRLYSTVVGVRFTQLVLRSGGGQARWEEIERGEIVSAFEFDSDAALQFGEDVAEIVRRLSPARFELPFAGLGHLEPPLEAWRLERSKWPAWVCAVREGRSWADIVAKVERGSSVHAWGRGGEIAERGCASLREALRTAETEAFRTLPVVRRLREREVSLERGSTLSGATWLEALASLPEEVHYEKRWVAGKTGGARDTHHGLYRGQEGRYHGVERRVVLGTAMFDLAARPAWVARFVFSTRERRFGAEARDEVLQEARLLVGIVPLRDPLMSEAAAGEPLAVPEEGILQRVLSRLEGSSEPGPEDALQALGDPELWPAFGDWLVVSCDDQGDASYGIAPFVDAARVGNPETVCPALERVLESHGAVSQAGGLPPSGRSGP